MKVGRLQTGGGYDVTISGDATYVHNQETAAAVWIISHNLKKYVAVSVVDTSQTEIEGDVVYIDENTVRVSFSAPFSGCAYCN